jgi:catechol 2,3-dioxygenase-like lactoylglutathione lyase family enzyme
MIKGIENIGICTTDVAKSVAFYQRLGFCESYRNDRGRNIALSSGGRHGH